MSESEHTITIKHKCKACQGTGVYVGLAERDGYGVECSRCKGTGCRTFTMTYEDFAGRVDRDDVHTVVACNPGIFLSVDLDFGGLPYTEWRRGVGFSPGTEMRRLTCPAWWYQLTDLAKKPNWDQCAWGGRFCDCKHFDNKAACWARWDKEFWSPRPKA